MHTKSKILPGKRVGDALYIHRSAANDLSKDNQDRFDSALKTLPGQIDEWNIVRISSENVAFLYYENFDEDPFPQLSKSTAVDLVRSSVRQTDYSNHTNRPILHRKELTVALDYPQREVFTALTQKLEKFGLFFDSHRIGFKNQWTERLDKNGVLIEGHRAKMRKPAANNDVDRHRTALVRYQLSQPVQLLLRHGLLSEGKTFFDFGCGQGDDVNGLQQGGFEACGWDPHFTSENPQTESDVVNLGFVLNVIEEPKERVKALKAAWSLTRKILSIAVMPPSSDAIENAKPYSDGFLTSRGTFQKYYTQEQLREYVRQTLGEDPIAIASGIFFVFRDKLAEQEFLIKRYHRHRYQAVTIRPDRPRPSTSVKPLKADVLRPQLEQLWQEILDRGRYVKAQELPDELVDAFRAERVSLKRAEQYCRDELVDSDLLDKSAADRCEDLLLYFALEMFSDRQPYRQLPKSLQLDVREFFGSHGNAQIEARILLFSTGDANSVREACEEIADKDLGYLLNNDQMMFHVSVLDMLPPILRCYIGCAGVLYGDISAADLVKIHISTGKLTLQFYDDFLKALPELKQRVKINMRTQRVRIYNYQGDNKQYLYMKSLYIPDSFDDFLAQSKFDRSVQKLGVFDFSNYGPNANYFNDTLQELGWVVDGFYLRKG
jgi:DNA phosphorothioation-associated putative methyltransferase